MRAHVHVCRNFKGYEEVRVPAAKTAGAAPGERVVLISEMEDWAQLAFAGYKCGRPAVLFRVLPIGLRVHALHVLAGAAPGERVVLISKMEDWTQLAFAGYKVRVLQCLLSCIPSQDKSDEGRGALC